MSHHRRTVRHPVQLAVRIVDGGRPQPALTADVSEHGLFVRTDEHWVANALVRLHLVDPEDPRPLALLGIVARCISLGSQAPEGPGIGVSLFGNGHQVETRWRALVRRAAAAAAGWRGPLDAAGTVDAVRRQHTRRAALLEVALETEGTRRRADLTDISEGGAFLRLEALIDVETSARIHFTARSGEAADVHAVVVRCADSLDPNEKGLGLKITPLSAAEGQRWSSFLARHAPVRRTLPAFLPSFDPEPKDPAKS